MRAILIAASTLGLLATGALADTAAHPRREEPKARKLDPLEPRDESARLVRTTSRVIRDSDGRRVVVTRRIYEDPAGVRTVRETRYPLDSM